MWFAVIIVVVIFIFVLVIGSKEQKEKQEILEKYRTEKAERDRIFKQENEERLQRDLLELNENREKVDEQYRDAVHSIEFDVAGIFYRTEAAKEEAWCLACGQQVNLRFDPTNPYDEYAIKVISNRKHIGFVPEVDNIEVREYMETHKFKAVVLHAYRTFNYTYHDYDIFVTIKVYFLKK